MNTPEHVMGKHTGISGSEIRQKILNMAFSRKMSNSFEFEHLQISRVLLKMEMVRSLVAAAFHSPMEMRMTEKKILVSSTLLR